MARPRCGERSISVPKEDVHAALSDVIACGGQIYLAVSIEIGSDQRP